MEVNFTIPDWAISVAYAGGWLLAGAVLGAVLVFFLIKAGMSTIGPRW